jgi:predicted nucleic acid-binding Zn ribbon protein
MERAIKLLGESTLAGQCISDERLAFAAWERAAGRKIASCTRPESLVRGHLVVETDDEVWRRQLAPLRSQIRANLSKVLGRDIVTSIEFRLGARRRSPGRETCPVRSGQDNGDEANAIADPILSRLYKASRRRETA